MRPGIKVGTLLSAGIVPLLLLVAALNPAVLWWARILFGVIVATSAIVLGRVASVAIIAKPDRLVIRNVRNTHRIPWAQIGDIFETPPPAPSVYRDKPLFRREIDLLIGLVDRSVISATLYSHGLFPTENSDRKEVIDRLNELRRQLSPPQPGQSSVAGSGPDLLS